MFAQPQQEHHWLQKLVGEWTVETTCQMGPDQPPQTFAGTETVRALGVWVQCEGTCPMPDGGTGTTLLTLGYDPAQQRYVGSFVGSMMTHQWVYEGQRDGDGQGSVLTLDTVGPSFAGDGQMVPYKDVVTIEDDDHRTLTSFTRGADGQWQGPFMTARYRRKK